MTSMMSYGEYLRSLLNSRTFSTLYGKSNGTSLNSGKLRCLSLVEYRPDLSAIASGGLRSREVAGSLANVERSGGGGGITQTDLDDR